MVSMLGLKFLPTIYRFLSFVFYIFLTCLLYIWVSFFNHRLGYTHPALFNQIWQLNIIDVILDCLEDSLWVVYVVIWGWCISRTKPRRQNKGPILIFNQLNSWLCIEVGRARSQSDIADKMTGVLSAWQGSWGAQQALYATGIVNRYCFSERCRMLELLNYKIASKSC